MNRIRTAAVVLALAALVIAPAGAQRTSPAQLQLEAASQKETLQGDLPGAIKQYQAIVNTYSKTDRLAAATALIRIADLYRRLGDAQARETYAKVVSDFSDQPVAVEAKTRLAAMGPTNPVNPTVRNDRVVKAGDGITGGDGRVSPDGRFISYTDWDVTGNLMLHNLDTGKDRPLTGNKRFDAGNAESSAFSPDGKQVAYGWLAYGSPNHSEIRIVSLEGAGVPESRRVFGNDDISELFPSDWSPDGKTLAVHAIRRDRSGQIALVGLDGSFQPLKTFGWRGPHKMFFSPDGKYLAYDLPAGDGEAQHDVFIMALDLKRETRVEHQAGDVVMGWSPDGRHLLFASDRIDGTTVGLWALPVADGKPQAVPVPIRPDIGTTISQGLTASGALYIVKDASTLSLAPIDLETGKLTGPSIIESVGGGRPHWSPDGTSLAYEWTDASGHLMIAVRSAGAPTVKKLALPLSYLNEPRWMPDGRSIMVGGRDLNGLGVVYRVDAQTGKSSFVTEALPAFPVQVAPDGQHIYSQRTRELLFELDLNTGSVRDMKRPAGGFPELSPDGRLIATVNQDSAAKVSTVNVTPSDGRGETRELLRVSLPDELVMYPSAISWTADSQNVIVVGLTSAGGGSSVAARKHLWLVPVNGGKTRKLDVDLSDWSENSFRLSPNGKQIAFFTGKNAREVRMLENVLPSQAKP